MCRESSKPSVALSSRFAVGDEVFSRFPDFFRARDGSRMPRYIVVAESEVALKPKSIDHVHAAALPYAGLSGVAISRRRC